MNLKLKMNCKIYIYFVIKVFIYYNIHRQIKTNIRFIFFKNKKRKINMVFCINSFKYFIADDIWNKHLQMHFIRTKEAFNEFL